MIGYCVPKVIFTDGLWNGNPLCNQFEVSLSQQRHIRSRTANVGSSTTAVLFPWSRREPHKQKNSVAEWVQVQKDSDITEEVRGCGSHRFTAIFVKLYRTGLEWWYVNADSSLTSDNRPRLDLNLEAWVESINLPRLCELPFCSRWCRSIH